MPADAPLHFHPLLPATEAARDAWSDFIYTGCSLNPCYHEDESDLRRKYNALKAQDPGALLNEAEELERAYARDPRQFSNLAAVAAQLREEAATLTALIGGEDHPALAGVAA